MSRAPPRLIRGNGDFTKLVLSSLNLALDPRMHSIMLQGKEWHFRGKGKGKHTLTIRLHGSGRAMQLTGGTDIAHITAAEPVVAGNLRLACVLGLRMGWRVGQEGIIGVTATLMTESLYTIVWQVLADDSNAAPPMIVISRSATPQQQQTPSGQSSCGGLEMPSNSFRTRKVVMPISLNGSLSGSFSAASSHPPSPLNQRDNSFAGFSRENTSFPNSSFAGSDLGDALAPRSPVSEFDPALSPINSPCDLDARRDARNAINARLDRQFGRTFVAWRERLNTSFYDAFPKPAVVEGGPNPMLDDQDQN